jgi:hypothetical protein
MLNKECARNPAGWFLVAAGFCAVKKMEINDDIESA